MSVYVDGANIRAAMPNGPRTVRGTWRHMTADTRAELDAMADRIGLRRPWIQNPGQAVAAGAIEVDSRRHTSEVLMPRRRRPKGDRCSLQVGHDGDHWLKPLGSR